jgi:hypothetical protein
VNTESALADPAELYKRHGYAFVRELPSGEWAGLMPMLFTVGLFVGLDDDGYRVRYCYERFPEALLALAAWDGKADPPGPWIKRKGAGGDVLGPGAIGP